jgi:hypothetical protein
VKANAEANRDAIHNDDRNQPPEPAPRKTPRGLDPELQAMAKIDRIMAELDNGETEALVIQWFLSKYVQKYGGSAVKELPHSAIDPRD